MQPTTLPVLKAPFPYFGGKSRVASLVWDRLGADSGAYVEPFAGSAAMLLGRPGWDLSAGVVETINDADGFVANFWRAVRADPEQVAYYADYPVSEVDLHARHVALVGARESLVAGLLADPVWFDPRVAGWWCWGLSCWIGSGWCSGNGPWSVVDGVFGKHGAKGEGVIRQRPHLGNKGQGVKRKLPHLSNKGQGVNRKLPHLGDKGKGVNRAQAGDIAGWMIQLANRLERVRVCAGDWARVVTPIASGCRLSRNGVAMFLDPPYATDTRHEVYTVDSFNVAKDVAVWAAKAGEDLSWRICVAGYEGEEHHEVLVADHGWTVVEWATQGGMGLTSKQESSRGVTNRVRERLWFSPGCYQGSVLFD
jgi:hypothetical protein